MEDDERHICRDFGPMGEIVNVKGEIWKPPPNAKKARRKSRKPRRAKLAQLASAIPKQQQDEKQSALNSWILQRWKNCVGGDSHDLGNDRHGELPNARDAVVVIIPGANLPEATLSIVPPPRVLNDPPGLGQDAVAQWDVRRASEVRKDTDELVSEIGPPLLAAPQSSESQSPAPWERLVVSFQPPQVRIDGNAYALKPLGAKLFDALVKAKGEWINGTGVVTKCSRVLARMPAVARGASETAPGKGCRLRPKL